MLAWLADTAAASPAGPTARLQMLYGILLASFALVILVIVLAIVLRQYGRRAARRRGGPSRTEYVDAWQQYRLRDEDLPATDEDPEEPDAPN